MSSQARMSSQASEGITGPQRRTGRELRRFIRQRGFSTETSMKQQTAILPVVDEVASSCVSSVLARPAGEVNAPRRFVGLLLVVAFFCVPASVVAQDDPCAGIIADSLVVTVELRDDRKFARHANTFCEEYSQATSNNRSFSASLSYDFLKNALKWREASANDIAQTFCGAVDSSQAIEQAFQIYKEIVSPEAYDAYRVCRQTLRRGAHVTPEVLLNKKRVTISMWDDRKDPERFQGIDSSIFKCRDGDKTIDRKGVNSKEVALSSDALNVVCDRVPVTCSADTPDQRCPTRLPKEMPSYQFYPEGHLTLNLSSGQQNIEFQSLEDGPIIREFGELEERVAELRRVLDAHDDKLADLNAFRDLHAHEPLSKMRWHDVKYARVNAGRLPAPGDNRYSTITFRNERDYQIVVSVTSDGDSSYCELQFVVDGKFFHGPISGNSKFVECQMSMLVPPRSSYQVFYKKSIRSWHEFFASDV